MERRFLHPLTVIWQSIQAYHHQGLLLLLLLLLNNI